MVGRQNEETMLFETVKTSSEFLQMSLRSIKWLSIDLTALPEIVCDLNLMEVATLIDCLNDKFGKSNQELPK